ncbi:hypothetical protein POM88_009677 [Heracleum sosnowskyi]|uniref:Uncharacterized protein n=1 Tax=Heracleum sosnowskyi TaxID=360622 RepID=A0AAD8N7P9_9APIA|nr:hypothetical protein POM88_009677 [Heracleum sosnowskyi]
MDYYNARYQDQENDREDEETISLSDFPLTSDQHDPHETEDQLCRCQDLQSPAEKTEIFEFSSYPNSIMSHAEDIINCGKLIPFKEQYHVSQNLYGRRCRSESLPELKNSGCQSNSSKMKMRNSRSLDYQKLSRNSSMSSDSPDSYRNNSRSSSRFDGSSKNIPKPRWYILMFGIVKFPTEMDLQDIKNRQVHRTPSKSLFPGIEEAKKDPINRKSSWGVLKVLSCRDDASINVTGSLACMPQV